MKKAFLFFGLVACNLFAQGYTKSAELGYKPTGQLDTIAVEVAIAVTQAETSENVSWTYPRKNLVIIEAYAEMEKYSYVGDRMPPQEYGDQWYIKRYLDLSGNEIKQHIWLVKAIENKGAK